MALVNAYCTLDELKEELSIDVEENSFSSKLERSINAASRQINGHCGRRFWQDAAVVARYYHADSPWEVCTDDISTTTGLLVAVDTGNNGLYSTSLTISTDFRVEPLNAAAEVPAWPFTSIHLYTTGVSSFATGGERPAVKVTAKFGWPAVPDDINKACLAQSVQLFKAADAPFGGVQLGFDSSGVVRLKAKLNATAEALCEPYRKDYV